jgi:hypothetical protein
MRNAAEGMTVRMTPRSMAMLILFGCSCQCGGRLIDELPASVTPSTLGFGVVTPLAQRELTVTLHNPSQRTLTFDAVISSGSRDGAFDVPNAPLTVGAGDDGALTVRYTGAAAAADSADVATLAVQEQGDDTPMSVELAGRTALTVGDAGDPGNDAGPHDAGVADAGTPDAGAPDAGAPDAGTYDAGPIDLPVFDGGGQCGATNVIVRTLSMDVLESLKAVPTADGFAMVWSDVNAGQEIYFERRSSAGNPLVAPTLITSQATNYDLGFAWNGQNGAVAWPHSRDGGNDDVSVMFNTLGSNGATLSTTVAITADQASGGDDYAIAWNPTSQEWLLTTYTTLSTYPQSTHVTRLHRFSASGAALAAPVEVTGGKVHWMDTPIVPLSDGYLLALQDGASLDLNVLRLDLNAQVVSTTSLGHRIGDNVVTVAGPSTVAVAMGGYESPNGSPVQLALLAPDGGVVTGAPLTVSNGGWVGAAWNGSSYTVVFDRMSADGGSAVWEARYAEDGTRVSAPRQLTCSAFAQVPQLVFANGVHVVLYEDYAHQPGPGTQQLLLFP